MIEYYLNELIRKDGEVTSKMLHDLITDNQANRAHLEELFERYKATEAGVPVLTRTFTDVTKINNKINNDFFGDIIDIKVGYFAGEPISYKIDDERAANVLDNFKLVNHIPDVDAETVKMMARCGYGARLCYIDREGQERIMNVDPWEVIFITDMTINEPQYAMRYYRVKVQAGDHSEEVWRVEWYDDEMVTYYIERSGQFVLDNTEAVNPKPHLFEGVPLIGFPNNEELMGDCEKVLNLIDGYDNTLSDVNSEVEQFRLAYLAFYGYDPDPETMEKAQRTGAFGLDIEGKIEFITKDLNDQIIENHLDRLENNIYKFSQTPNFSDEAFAGSQSGEARKYKMLPFENKCATTERKMTKSLMEMFKILSTAWAKKGIAVEWKDIEMTFTRNFPLDLLHEAEVQAKLKGLVSDMTRLSLFSAVEDPAAELEAMDAERPVDLDQFGGDEDEPVEQD